MSVCHILIFLWLIISTKSSKTTLAIYRIDAHAQIQQNISTRSALIQQIAIDEINANPNILPNYTLEMTVLEAVSDEEALQHALTISQLFSGCSSQHKASLVSPIILGTPWSSWSMLTSRVFNINHLFQISAAATSPILSDKSKYRSFFRTIPNDVLEAEALVTLCKYFNWTKIGVVYFMTNDNYWPSMNTLIKEAAFAKDIETYSISFNYNDSMTTVVEFIKDKRLFVTILLAPAGAVKTFLNAARISGILGNPYFFIGTSRWFSVGDETEYGLVDSIIGYIGTVDAIPAMFSLNDYKKNNIYEGNIAIYNISRRLVQRQVSNVNVKMNGTNVTFEIGKYPHVAMAYAYDAVYAMAYALDTYDKKYSLEQLKDYNRFSNVSDLLYKILDDTHFVGMSGLVNFTDGDRADGMIYYGNVKDNGTIGTIGYYGNVKNNLFAINRAQVIWPKDFTIPPRTTIVVQSNYTGVSEYSIASTAAIYGLICCNALFVSHKNRYSPERNVYISMNIGLVLCCIWMFLYGIQRHTSNDRLSDVWCVGSPIILCVIFTLTFVAFIAAKSELMRILIKFMKRKQFAGYKGRTGVVNKLWKCLCADMIAVLTYLIVYFTMDLKLLKGEKLELGEQKHTVDSSVDIQEFYAVCSWHSRWTLFTCWTILFFYKIIQIVYAIDTNMGFSGSFIIVIVCIFCVGVIAGSWYGLNQLIVSKYQISLDAHYVILSFVIISLYLLWIIWEYYHLCNKKKGNGEDMSSVKSTMGSQMSTTTRLNTATASSHKFDHLTCGETEELCKVELTQIHEYDDIIDNDNDVLNI